MGVIAKKGTNQETAGLMSSSSNFIPPARTVYHLVYMLICFLSLVFVFPNSSGKYLATQHLDTSLSS